MRAQRAPLRPTFSPARLCHVVYAGFSGGQMETILAWDSTSHGGKLPEGYLHLTCENAARFTRSCKAATRKPTSRANWRRSVRSAVSLFAIASRAAIASSKRTRRPRRARSGLGQAAQNDARFGGADRRKTDARAVESRSDQRASGEGWRRLYQSRAHLSACLERQERRGHAVSSLASQRQKIQQAQGQEFGARADSEPRRYR